MLGRNARFVTSIVVLPQTALVVYLWSTGAG